MPFFALTTLEKLQRVPLEFWLRLGMIIAVVVLGIILIRSISQMNKLMLTMTVILLMITLGFHWIFERGEPKILTPLINKIAPFFPSKDSTRRW